MLPLNRNDGMEPKRHLSYATAIADFYLMQIVAKKILSRGQNRRVGRVSGNKTIFFFGLRQFINQTNRILVRNMF